MKTIKVLIFATILSLQAVAQENPKVKEALQKKYEYVTYNEGFEDLIMPFYHISTKVGSIEKCSGACDLKGKEVVPPIYDFVNADMEFYYPLLNGKYGVVDKTGKLLIVPEKYDYISKDYDYFTVKINGPDANNTSEGAKYGLYGKKGEEILPCTFDYIFLSMYKEQLYDKGFALVKRNDKWGVYSLKGKEVIPCQYTNIYCHDSLEAVIVTKGGYNKKGIIYPTIDGKWGLMSLAGQTILDCKYDYIGKPSEGLLLCNKGGHVRENGVEEYPEDGLFGFVDYKGKEILPCIYSQAFPFKDGVSQVVKDGVASVLVNPLSGTQMKIANGGGSIAVDNNIPETSKSSDNTFAFVFANENYTNLVGADYSINDGKVFKEYCRKTLGIPEKNIRYFEDATYGILVGAIRKIRDIADVYDGDAKIIVYYSGLGTSDNNGNGYILPTDASLDALEATGYNVQKLMDAMNALNTEVTLVILDSPFSGLDKVGKPLTQHRGVAIKSRAATAAGGVILCTSSSQSETALSDKKYGHSIYTYALLEKLQTTKGACTIKEAVDHAAQWVKRESMKSFDRLQTPQTTVSEKMNNKWNEIKWQEK